MGLFDEFSRVLETRLEEFLRNNPHLELQALLEQLDKQQEDTLHLIADLQRQEKKIEGEILTTAQEIQLWHNRINKAKEAGRLDLVNAAQEREAALLRQGNQQWGKMVGFKERIAQSKLLYKQIKQKKEEVKIKASQVKPETKPPKTEPSSDKGWQQTNYSKFTGYDPLEDQFQKWEADSELEKMKREINKNK